MFFYSCNIVFASKFESAVANLSASNVVSLSSRQFSHGFLALVGVSAPWERRLDLRRPPGGIEPGVAPAAAAAAAAAPRLDFFDPRLPAETAGDAGGFFFPPVPRPSPPLFALAGVPATRGAMPA